MSEFRDRLRPLVEKALVRERTVLASGKESSFYFDGKLVTLSAEGGWLLARHILATVPPSGYDAVGGPTLGADPIAAAVSALSFEAGTPKPAVLVRKAQKGHGRMKRVEGPMPAGARVLVVEDVATSGGSILDAVEALEEAGATVARIVTLVDRQQGARAAFESRGYAFDPVFTAEELGVSSDEIATGNG